MQAAKKAHDVLAAAAAEPAVEVRRFGLPDLEPRGLWLYGRLHKLYPGLAQNWLASWIRGAIETNGFQFLVAHKAVGLAQINHRPLEVRPFVEEIFVFTEDDDGIEGALAIYRAIQRWGRGMNAEYFVVGTATDLEAGEIAKVLGAVKMRTVYTVKV